MTKIVKFVNGEPVLLLGKTLVVADLHLGLEFDLAKYGIRIPTQIEQIRKSIEKLVLENDCNKLIILGDIKHCFKGFSYPEKPEIIKFVEALEKLVPVQIIKGNHDGAIQNYLKVYDKLEIGKFFLTHGHLQKYGISSKKTLIVGHFHPLFTFHCGLGAPVTERVWIVEKNRIVMPAFNPLLGGADARDISNRGAELYLLDGICISVQK